MTSSLLPIKRFIAKRLTSAPLSLLIYRVFRGRIPHHGTRLSVGEPQARSGEAAAILFRMYESAECRAVRRYIQPGTSVVELGGHIGGVSALISRVLASDDALIICEPNTELHALLDLNSRVPGGPAVHLVRAAVGRDGEARSFEPGSSGRGARFRPTDATASGVVPTVSLGALLDRFDIKRFVLVADIEGAESEILWDVQALRACSLLIMELHDVEPPLARARYTVSDMVEQLTQVQGFEIVERQGPVVVAVPRGSIA